MVQKVNVTLDNVSPLINYSPPGACRDGSSSDPSWRWYDNNGTFTLTTTFGASASLTFNGTAVWIYGAKRDNHAPFNTTLDGKSYYDTGFSSKNLFQQVLFPGLELSNAISHNVSIADSVTNPEFPYLDIDSIVYEVEVPDGSDQISQQDTAAAFDFTPKTAWSTNPGSVSKYSGGTGHVTTSADAYVVYSFEGSHVEIYGAVGPNGGAYTVQVDNGAPATFNGTKNALHTQTLLFQYNGNSPGNHIVKVSNTPFSGQTLSIDYATIYRLSSDGSGGSGSLSGGAIGGIVIGVCAGLLLILACAFLWYRNRRPKPISTKDPENTTDQGTDLVTFHTPTLPSTIESYQPLSVAASNPNLLQPPGANPTISPPHSNSSSDADSRSRLVLHNPNPSISNTSGPVQEGAPAPENAGLYPAPVNATRPLPRPEQSSSRARTNAAGLASLSDNDLRNQRMRVEGRLQDFGPVTFEDSENEGSLLPPDYNQATQPFPPRGR